MIAGRAGRAAALALLSAALAAPAALGAAPPTEVTGVQPAGAHSVRVIVKAAGDLATSDVEADLGGRFAFVEGVHQTGPVRPTDLVFAVDTSGSMAGAPIAAATAAGRRLLDAVGHTGRVGLVTFSDTAQVVRPLTADTDAVRTALAGLDTHSGTALYDGIGLAVDTALAGSDPGARRIVVVLSDGADTSSTATLAALTHRLRGAGVEVDAVGLESSPSFQAGPLRQIASATGGELAPTRTLAGLEPIALQLSQARLATTYAVDVSLPQSSARSLHVRVRGGTPASVALPAGVSGASTGFWSAYGGPLVIVLGVFAVGMVAFVVSAASGARVPPLSTRLAQYTAEGGAGSPRARSLFLLELSEALEARLGERWAWKRLDRLCGQAGIVRPTGHVALATAASAAAGGLAATAFLGLLAGIVGLAAGLAAPIAALRFRAARRHRQFEAELPELLSVWASALRAGRSFTQALDSIVDEAGEPAHTEFRRAQQQVRLGVPVEQALDEMSQRLRSESFELVVLTTDVQRRVGGNVAEIFDQVADTVRRRHQFSARVKALTSMGRLSAQVLIGMPFAMAGMLTLINHGYMRPLYTTRTGHILIAVGLAMMTAGALILRRMVRPRTIA
ncbi:MAG: VWA domain-containing protein [Gaiellales bacterium]